MRTSPDSRIGKSFHLPTGDSFDLLNLFHIVLRLKQLNRGKRRAAREGISHKGRSVHQRMFRVIIEKSIKYLFILPQSPRDQCNRRSMPFRGPEYPEAPDLHKAVSGSAKSGCHLIKTSSTPYLSQSSLAFSKMKCRTSAFRQHPVKRFHQHAVQLVMILFKCFLQRRIQSECEPHTGLHHTLSAQNGSPIIACLHRLKGIAVVRVFQRQNHCSLLIAAVHIIPQRHFQRYSTATLLNPKSNSPDRPAARCQFF